MAEERLTEIPTSWTTISSAHTPGPKSQAAMEELVGRYHDAVTRYIHLKVRDKHLADEVLQEFWTKLLDRQARRRRQDQGTVPRLPAYCASSADHRSFPFAKTPTAAAGRSSRFDAAR